MSERPEANATSIADVRRDFARTLCATAGVCDARIEAAFAAVARETFLGPGPWSIFTIGGGYGPTPDDDPVHVYRDVLIGIDPGRYLNNGQPSAHAQWIAALAPAAGDQLVHVGCGTGYYAAVLAELVGRGGRVTALELDPELARRATENLRPWPQVTVVATDGSAYDPGEADAIYVNAGASEPMRFWLDCLRPGGRMTLPIVRWPTDSSELDRTGQGVMLRVGRDRSGWTARILSPVWIFPCIGAVTTTGDRAVKAALERGVEAGRTYVLRREPHDETPRCWMHGESWCLTETGGAPPLS